MNRGRSSSDLLRNSSASSWTGSETSPIQSPKQLSGYGPAATTSYAQKAVQSARQQEAAGEDVAVQFTVGDEEDGDAGEDGGTPNKRDTHTLNEQRRRDLIKQGYAQLAEIVPTCKQSPSGGKLSRAAMLQKTIDYVVHQQTQALKQVEQVEKLEREVKALRIMSNNYEQIAEAQEHSSASEEDQVPDWVKSLVFQRLADQLFQSFNSSISVTSFDTLSSCIISWLEEYCKPQALREIVLDALQKVNSLAASAEGATNTSPGGHMT